MTIQLNERYPGRFDNPSSQYPQGAFKNRSAPGVLDGSYLEKDWANDKEGLFQSLLVAAGVTPNGRVDTVGDSQYFDALLQVISANSPRFPGQIIWVAGDTAPVGTLKANASAVSRTVYANLFSAIGTRYGAGNGTTTFNLPDMRGEFPRGWDDGRGVDTGRLLGSSQAAFAPPVPRDGWGTTGSYPSPTTSILAGRIVVGSGQIEQQEDLESLRASGNNNTPLAGDNRPRNIALLACIVY